MRSNNTQGKLSNDRLREYQRQQERLKAMAATSEKTPEVSADIMIENLLKNSFKKMPEISTTVEHVDQLSAELPLWLQCNSASVPAQYKYLWSVVQATKDIADTQRVSQLLLTSGLQVDILGFIWNLANKAIPGQLTKQEFYIVLALVSLVQTGYTFNDLSILKLITVPSMPVLQLGLLKCPVPQFDVFEKTNTASSESEEPSGLIGLEPKPPISLNESNKKDQFIGSEVSNTVFLNDITLNVSLKETNGSGFESNNCEIKSQNLQPIEHVSSELYKNSKFPSIGLSPTAEIEDDFSAFQSVSLEADKNECKNVSQPVCDSFDDFSEFQSANTEHLDPFETVVVSQKREIPKIPLPKTLTRKFSNTKSSALKISPESGKKLKVISGAESLSSLFESKISSNNKVSTSVSILGSNHGIGSRLANHSFSSKLEKPKCHKHHKTKVNPSSPLNQSTDAEIILGVRTKNLETVIPKCRPKNSAPFKTVILKETKIRNDDSAAADSPAEVSGNELEPSDICSGEKTRQIEIPMLGTFNETVLPTQSKSQSSNVDLIVVQEDKYSALREIELELNQEKNSEVKEMNDDFGDFLSADISALSAPEPQPSIDPNSQSHSIKNEDSWGDWNFNTDTSISLSNMSEPATSHTNNFADIDNIPAVKADDDLFGSFNLLTISDCKETSQSNSVISQKMDLFNMDCKNGDSGGGAVMFGDKNEKSKDLALPPKTDESVNNQLDNEFWGFLTSEPKPSDGNSFSRHGSLPNLDLNLLPTDEAERENIWKKCIDSCQSLIQEGFDIFNNIVTKSVLDEVFAAPETAKYLNNLNIVCHISKRVFQNYNEISSSQNEIERLWGRLQDLCFEYNIKLKPDEDSFSQGKFRCGICLKYVGQDDINQGTNHYHPSCANLWINYIEDILPSAM